ncbi:hypothetical protein MAUB1S_09713 [Mycolicibacterium aubagnense]
MDVAIIEIETGHVVTVVALETIDGYEPGPELHAVDATGKTAYAGCTWTEVGGFVEPPPEPIDPAELKPFLMAYAADKRWRVETSGITVGGEEIRTDEKSQNRVTGAALLALSDPELVTIDWEALPGVWIEVSAATMKSIGIAVGRHVQACFTVLKAVQSAIQAGTITSTAEIDAANWPS